MLLPRRLPILSCLFLLATCIGVPRLALADFTSHVVGVTDGDTIKVMRKGKAEKVRLSGMVGEQPVEPVALPVASTISEDAWIFFRSR